MALQSGQKIGDYEVQNQLGYGGIGEVYKVRHVISQRVEALKLLRSDRSQGDLPERFLREIRVLAALNHPHIARLHTAFNFEGQIAMVMEYIEGQDLHWKMRSQWPLRASEGMTYLRQVLAALDYAHAQGVVHRDIKPSNIMITPQSDTKLLDFGMAFQAADISHTKPGHVLGSVHYMSPEQVRGERVDPRSDLYSTGVTLYELLVGRRPFEAATEYEVMTGHVRQAPQRPGDLNPAIPPPLSDAILRALEKDPASRFQTAGEFLRALEGLRLDDAATLETMAFKVDARLSSETPKSGPARQSGPSRPSASSFEPSLLDSVSKELAAYIGPIAKVVVRRAAEQSSSLNDLYSRVAAEIPSDRDRSNFLAKKKR